MRRLPLGLLLSAMAHAALLLGVLSAFGFTEPRMLFVDLVEGLGFAGAGGSGGGGSSGEPGPQAAPTRGTAPAERSTVRTPPMAIEPPPPAPEPPASEPSRSIISPTEPPAPTVEARPTPRAEARPTPPAAAPATTSSAPHSSSADAGAGTTGATTPSASGSGAGVGGPGAEGAERVGQGGTGSGGGLGAGAGAHQGSAVALAVPGDGASIAPEYEGYYALLRSRIADVLRYPAAARRRGITGQVQIEVRVTASGEIDRAAVVVSSSHPLLDAEALAAVRRLGRVPFPEGLRPRPLSMRLPVDFVLN
jgi:TonB family protein